MEKDLSVRRHTGLPRAIGERILDCLSAFTDWADRALEVEDGQYPRLVYHGDGLGMAPDPKLGEFVTAEAARLGLGDNSLATLLDATMED